MYAFYSYVLGFKRLSVFFLTNKIYHSVKSGISP